jgi:hypothetical protein
VLLGDNLSLIQRARKGSGLSGSLGAAKDAAIVTSPCNSPEPTETAQQGPDLTSSLRRASLEKMTTEAENYNEEDVYDCVFVGMCVSYEED